MFEYGKLFYESGIYSIALLTFLLISDVVGNRSSDIEAKVERRQALFVHTGPIVRDDFNLLPIYNSKYFMILNLPADALKTFDFCFCMSFSEEL